MAAARGVLSVLRVTPGPLARVSSWSHRQEFGPCVQTGSHPSGSRGVSEVAATPETQQRRPRGSGLALLTQEPCGADGPGPAVLVVGFPSGLMGWGVRWMDSPVA